MKELIEKWKQIVQEESGDKYCGAGIYGIYIADKLVYIGRSKDLLKRVAEHCVAIEGYGRDARANKYKILREARRRGYEVRFDVLEYWYPEKDIHQMECQWIRTYLPKLNTQIPKIDNSRGYEINYAAKTVCLNDILEEKNYEF